MIRVIIIYMVTVSICALAAWLIYWKCYDRVMWVYRRLDEIEDHVCKMEDYYKIEAEQYYQLAERMTKIEKRCKDDGK